MTEPFCKPGENVFRVFFLSFSRLVCSMNTQLYYLADKWVLVCLGYVPDQHEVVTENKWTWLVTWSHQNGGEISSRNIKQGAGFEPNRKYAWTQWNEVAVQPLACRWWYSPAQAVVCRGRMSHGGLRHVSAGGFQWGALHMQLLIN